MFKVQGSGEAGAQTRGVEVKKEAPTEQDLVDQKVADLLKSPAAALKQFQAMALEARFMQNTAAHEKYQCGFSEDCGKAAIKIDKAIKILHVIASGSPVAEPKWCCRCCHR